MASPGSAIYGALDKTNLNASKLGDVGGVSVLNMSRTPVKASQAVLTANPTTAIQRSQPGGSVAPTPAAPAAPLIPHEVINYMPTGDVSSFLRASGLNSDRGVPSLVRVGDRSGVLVRMDEAGTGYFATPEEALARGSGTRSYGADFAQEMYRVAGDKSWMPWDPRNALKGKIQNWLNTHPAGGELDQGSIDEFAGYLRELDPDGSSAENFLAQTAAMPGSGNQLNPGYMLIGPEVNPQIWRNLGLGDYFEAFGGAWGYTPEQFDSYLAGGSSGSDSIANDSEAMGSLFGQLTNDQRDMLITRGLEGLFSGSRSNAEGVDFSTLMALVSSLNPSRAGETIAPVQPIYQSPALSSVPFI